MNLTQYLIFILGTVLVCSCSDESPNQTTITTTTTYSVTINGVKIDSIVGDKKASMNHGMWEYYSKGELIQKTFYDQGKEVYIIDGNDTTRGSFFDEYQDEYPNL